MKKSTLSRHSRLAFLLVLTCFIQGISKAQQAVIKVQGEVLKPLSLSIEDLSKLPQISITAKDKDAENHVFSGVALNEVLKLAGVTLGAQLRGKNLSKFVLAKANDGYEVLFALPELDSDFSDDIILLATKADGKPLGEGVGPFRLVVPKDKKHARWIRELNSIQVVNAGNK
ncbi:Oxidoreductase molybdopterin binding domain-containing protein [Pseudarcicella hirudinis]|uniref:Oxidoreductase molybdopterin binding domain-containing protein n=1 Tax=Pseudarcicella hirudinis TaxID=1079859 RepID=A0A1I5M1Y7_9BACT|nr:molybdopterin-dependent oxidoreductase [Pseudarcicella hirudinis]SFP02996.1 Oxidoreductase molybdopterin binding domain-containing protein [Pseudarcicella hirudinis]